MKTFSEGQIYAYRWEKDDRWHVAHWSSLTSTKNKETIRRHLTLDEYGTEVRKLRNALVAIANHSSDTNVKERARKAIREFDEAIRVR